MKRVHAGAAGGGGAGGAAARFHPRHRDRDQPCRHAAGLEPRAQAGRRLRAGPGDTKLAGDNAPVLLIGLTPAGRAVADALAYN
ncbi:MAG: hypothetical protein ACK554_06810, partial [Erythrobacteraceae bacterium]